MVESVRIEVLFLSSLTPCCEQIFPQRFCSGDFANSIRPKMGQAGQCRTDGALDATPDLRAGDRHWRVSVGPPPFGVTSLKWLCDTSAPRSYSSERTKPTPGA